MFEYGGIGVVVCWIAIDESVQKQGVEWEPPVRRGGCILVSFPFSPVIDRIGCCLVLIQVVLHIGWVVSERRGCKAKDEKQYAQNAPAHNEERRQNECINKREAFNE